MAGAEARNIPVESGGAEFHRSPGVDQPSDPGGQKVKCGVLRPVNELWRLGLPQSLRHLNSFGEARVSGLVPVLQVRSGQVSGQVFSLNYRSKFKDSDNADASYLVP